MTDYYKTLGVDRSASQDDIKKAYRKLAAQHHPDRGGDTAKFQELQQAYDAIGDPERRAAYDSPQPQNNGFYFNQGGFPPGFEDIFAHFGDAFGNRRNAPQKNKTINIQTVISLQDAFSGKELVASLTLPSGRDQLIEVKIPAGINDGTILRIAGLGDDSIPNIQRGDIHLSIHVQPHPEFSRQGDDLIKKLNVSCIDAMLGKSVSVLTIDGLTLEVKIAAGTQPGQILAVHGYGMPHISNSNVKGRLLIQINVTIPENLTEHQKNLLTQFLN